ncbi:MAG TPA: urate oxidase [Acidisarcina sp.]
MAKLAENRYGKSRVRLVKVTRGEVAHEVRDWNVNIAFEGDYESCFVAGDNSRVLPTDTMKNTVYSLARDSAAGSVEEFARELVEHFLIAAAAASTVSVEIAEKRWAHVLVDGQAHPTTFEQRDLAIQTTAVRGSRQGESRVVSGVKNLIILKTANSAFEGFVRDRLTTLPESSDRLFGTELTATWAYAAGPLDYPALRAQITGTLLTAFAEHRSLSVQHTLFAMGEAVLAVAGSVVEMNLSMPNRHCLLVNLAPFGQNNPNEIFVPIDEPHGSIEARIVR